MKRIKFNWKNGKITLFWPDYPLIIAGDAILDIIVQELEKNTDIESISKYITKKTQSNIEEVRSFVKYISDTLNSSVFLPVEDKNIDVVVKTPDRGELAMATLNLTKECNLKCTHCYASGNIVPNSNDMSIEEVKNAVTKLSEIIQHEPRLFIISGGEPTLEVEKLKVAVSVAHEKGLKVRLNTNGYYLDNELANFLATNKVLTQVSLDGIDRKTNALLRGREKAFDTAIDSIKRLVNANCRTRISFTVHSKNVHQIPDMISLAENLGVEQFTTSSLVLLGNALISEIKPVEFSHEFLIMYNAVKTSIERQRMTKSTLFAETINAIRAGVHFVYCGTGYSTCCVDSNGDVYPCINMVRDEYRALNINSENYKSEWENSPILKKLRNINVDTINSICSKCIFKYFCGGYCRGETLECGGTINSPYARCKMRKRGLIQIMKVIAESPDIYNFYKDEDPITGILHRE